MSHLYTLNVRFHSNRSTTNASEVSISIITYNIFQYCIYIYIDTLVYIYTFHNVLISWYCTCCGCVHAHAHMIPAHGKQFWFDSAAAAGFTVGWFWGVFLATVASFMCSSRLALSVCLQICIPEKVSWKWHFNHWTSSLQPTDCPCKSMVGIWRFILTFGTA